MSFADDIKLIKEQEKALVFPAFDETTAFEIGTALRNRALKEGFAIVAEVKTWNRLLFYMALPGTSANNLNWVRRKANLVQLRMASSYRVHLENGGNEPAIPPVQGLDNADYVYRGGSFPITVKGAGVIGAVTVSGLHERDDHRLVVEAICDVLKLDKSAFALPSL